MNVAQVLDELPAFTFEERQMVLRRVLELDDLALSIADERLIESRLAAHHLDPTSSLPLEVLKQRLKERKK